MEVRFSTAKLQRCFEDLDHARRTWGDIAGRKYVGRIELLYATERLEDLYDARSLRLHPLRGNRAGQFAITIHDRWRLIVEKEAVNEVRVVEVSRHYGD